MGIFIKIIQKFQEVFYLILNQKFVLFLKTLLIQDIISSSN